MNNELQKYLKKTGKEISLTHEEREKMRGVLRAYMAMKPIRAAATFQRTSAFNSNWFFTPRPVAAALVLAVFASSAGISYAAERALPGDILYPVKTHVNEPVRGALALSASAKTAWAMNVAGERIKEAATLAAKGHIDPADQLELQASFETHAREAIENLSQQASTSPEKSSETAVRFEAQLSEYERVLREVGTQKNIAVGALASSVQKERENAALVRVRAQANADEGTAGAKEDAVSHMRDSAKKQFGQSSRLAHTVGGALASSSAQGVAIQLENAGAAISGGDEFLDRDSTPKALNQFQKALIETEKLHVFLETTSDIHKRTGLIISQPEHGDRGGVNIGNDSQNMRAASSSTLKNIQSVDATTSNSATKIDSERERKKESSKSVQDNSGEGNRRDEQQQKKFEEEETAQNPVPAVHSVLPIAVPSPALP